MTNTLKYWFLLYFVLVSLATGSELAKFYSDPPNGIDCDSCRYWQSLGETL